MRILLVLAMLLGGLSLPIHLPGGGHCLPGSCIRVTQPIHILHHA